MNVLSLFDGMSCGQIAINRNGGGYNKYFASEIDKSAIAVTQQNYPETVQLGSVVNVTSKNLPTIQLLCGGSPCQSFSFAGKRKGMSTKCEEEILSLEQYLELKAQAYEFEGQSYLFWEYMRVLTEIRQVNPDVKFLLENVVMSDRWKNVLTRAIGVAPICIDSALVSAQHRTRLYWTNIGLKPAGLFGELESTITQPKDKRVFLKDILEPKVDERYFLSEKTMAALKKAHTNQAVLDSQVPERAILCCGRNPENPGSRKVGQPTEQRLEPRSDGKTNALTSVTKDNLIQVGNRLRRLTPLEYERLQTVPDGYTSTAKESQRYMMLANGWNVDTICHILSYLG